MPDRHEGRASRSSPSSTARPTDNNATLFKQGYDSVLKPKYDSGEYVKGPNQSVPDWDNAQAGTIFEQMLTQNKDIKGVLAANDGLGNAVISVLKKNKLNGKVPVTGQDATVQGLQNILAGDQCMTVYKAIKQEADAAADAGRRAGQGREADHGHRHHQGPGVGRGRALGAADPEGDLQGRASRTSSRTASSPRKQLCTGDFATLCTDNGIS